jgi:trans-aconitate 2-methyltransferase
VLHGEDAVYEWVSGTGLRPVQEGLADDELEPFLEEYRRRLREAYPVRPDGRVIYSFKRLFIVVQTGPTI